MDGCAVGGVAGGLLRGAVAGGGLLAGSVGGGCVAAAGGGEAVAAREGGVGGHGCCCGGVVLMVVGVGVIVGLALSRSSGWRVLMERSRSVSLERSGIYLGLEPGSVAAAHCMECSRSLATHQ